MSEQPTGRRKKGDTRRRILKAAAKLFATRGYAATSISAICAAAGVVPSSVYWEFGNKAGILAGVLEDAEKRWLEQSNRGVRAKRQTVTSDAPPLTAYFEYMAEAVNAGPEFARLGLMVAMERRHADAHALKIVREQRARFNKELAHLFETHGLTGNDDFSALDLAALTIACFDGATTAAQVDANADDLRRMFHLLYSAMLAILSLAPTPAPE